MARRSAALALPLTLAVVGSLAAAAPPASAGSAQTTAKIETTATRFALEASGYAGRAAGGQVPAGTGKVAYGVVACTNQAGVSKSKAQADGDFGNGLTFLGAATQTWTAKDGGKVSAWSRQTIDRVTLADTPAGDLYLNALTSTSHAWHTATGFHARSSSGLGSIVLDPPVGDDQEFPVPSPGQSVTVPGVAEIGLGASADDVGGGQATTSIDGVTVQSLFSDTSTRLSRTRASISGGVKESLYGGSAVATTGSELGVVTNARSVQTIVPCVGTDGAWTSNSADETALSQGVMGSGLRTRQQSGPTAPGDRPEVTTVSRVALVDFGAGLLVNGIRSKAHVMKTPSGYKRDIDGTTIGGVTYNGTDQPFPDDASVMTIPGVAKFEKAIVERTPSSIEVIGLRVTLLDGSGAVYDFGFAKALLRRSGL